MKIPAPPPTEHFHFVSTEETVTVTRHDIIKIYGLFSFCEFLYPYLKDQKFMQKFAGGVLCVGGMTIKLCRRIFQDFCWCTDTP